MLKRTCVYMDEQQRKLLEKYGKQKGLKLAQMIRLAISEYLAHQQNQENSVNNSAAVRREIIERLIKSWNFTEEQLADVQSSVS